MPILNDLQCSWSKIGSCSVVLPVPVVQIFCLCIRDGVRRAGFVQLRFVVVVLCFYYLTDILSKLGALPFIFPPLPTTHSLAVSGLCLPGKVSYRRLPCDNSTSRPTGSGENNPPGRPVSPLLWGPGNAALRNRRVVLRAGLQVGCEH